MLSYHHGNNIKEWISMSKSSRARGKVALAVLLVLVIAAAVFLLGKAKQEADSDRFFTMSGNAERVEFLNRQGYIVKPDPVRREDVTVPSEFNDTYKSYVEMQQALGLDLAEHKGDKATLFSYAVLNYPEYSENVFADLLVADNKLIACQLRYDDEENGFVKPLITKGLTDIEQSEAEPSENKAETTVPQGKAPDETVSDDAAVSTADVTQQNGTSTAATAADNASEVIFVPDDSTDGTNFE